MKKDNDMQPGFVATEADFRGAEDYVAWVTQIKQRYQKSQIKARIQVNASMLEFYWSLGHDIVRLQAEQRWGAGVLNKLSKDMKDAFPDEKGFSVNSLQYIKRWYMFYNGDTAIVGQPVPQLETDMGQLVPQISPLASPITKQLAAQLESVAYKLGDAQYKTLVGDYGFPYVFGLVPWGHHQKIVSHSDSIEQAIFYLRRTIQENWSRKELEMHWADYANEIASTANNFTEYLPAYQGHLANELFKDEYNLQFLRSKSISDEKDLEDAIANDVTSFLLQLGKGFAYVGRQMEFQMDEETSYFPDLLFYNIILKCYVVVELKVVEFVPEFAGKLNFYVNACNHLLKGDDNNPTIGLLICSSKNDTKVQWALEGINNPLAVAAHNILPTADEIKSGLKLKRKLKS